MVEPFWQAHVIARIQRTKNDDYDDYNVENDDGVYAECFEDEEGSNNDDDDPIPAEAVSVDGSSLHLPCNDFQDFDIINLIIQEIAKKFLLLQLLVSICY